MQNHARPRPSAAILLVVLASFNPARAGPVPRSEGIDAVVAVDTLRGPTGAPASERMVLDLLKHIAAMGVDVRVEHLSPELVTPGNILAAIDRLDATRLKDRTLFFYYGGHGATDPRWGHLLTTPGGDLQRTQLVDRIAKKAPRLAVVVTDVCSMEASMDGPGVLVPPPPERRAVENLLLQHTGIVDVNGSTYDPARGIRQAAFYHPATGGLFTRAFASMFWPGAEPIAADVPEDAPRFIGGEVTAGYARRFGPQALWRYDANGDGFLEWMEAEEYLRASLARLFNDFQTAAASGLLTVRPRPQDVELLRTQAGQDPQFFSLAAPSGRPGAPTPEAPAAPVARKPRLGVLLEDRTRIAGRYLEIRSVEPNSPAARAVFWKNGTRMKRSFPLVQGVVVTAANHRRVTCQADFFRVLDAVPDGEELNLTGYIDRRRRQPFEATVVLDGFR